MFIHPLQLLLEWKGFRRLYIYAMTENMKYDDVCDDDDDDVRQTNHQSVKV